MPARSASAVAPVRLIEAGLLERNKISGAFFARHSDGLATASREMAARFRRGGRLLAFGKGPYATDAQHAEVEFVHPILVGKRALPALDVSIAPRESLRALLAPNDIIVGFGPPDGDSELESLLAWAAEQGAMTIALPGKAGAFSIEPWDVDPFLHQELVEIVYHTLWETVHVFFEHRERGHDAGAAGFLYPFLGQTPQNTEEIIPEVAASIRAKAEEDARLRVQLAREAGESIARACLAIHDRVQHGGCLLLFGNGGSATDANDLALDCVASPKGHAPIPAISLAAAPATLSALANDVGPNELFLRQVIAYGRPSDVAIAISTSGGSRNVVAALEEARRCGLLTVALLGHDGGEIVRHNLVEHPIVVRSANVPRVQEVQASAYHVMLDLLDALRQGPVPAEFAEP